MSAAQFRDPEFQKKMRARVKKTSLSRAGRAGYDAVVEKYGVAQVAEWAAKHRRQHPSGLESVVAGWLNSLGVGFVSEQLLMLGSDYIFPDFYIENRRLIVEADGEVWHTNSELHGEDREQRQRERDAKINVAGLRIIHLKEAEIKDGTGFERLRVLLTTQFK